MDGVSLWERLGKKYDLVSVFCKDFGKQETLKAVNGLLLKSGADLPDGRRALFVCAECWDLGCGAITISVTRTEDSIAWSAFGYENDYEAAVLLDDVDVGPFEFDLQSYESSLLTAAAQLKSL